MRQPINYTNHKFGLLTAVSSRSTGNGVLWNCVCTCGNQVSVLACSLPKAKSCGCLKKYQNKRRYNTSGLKNGYSSHPLYKTWAGIVHRCKNPRNTNYVNYGARGIEVYQEWAHSPAGFITFMESIGWINDRILTVDRIDNNDGYFPWNIRLATSAEQANNTRRNKHLSYNGITKTIAQWAKDTGIHYATLTNRINKGWPVGRALAIK